MSVVVTPALSIHPVVPGEEVQILVEPVGRSRVRRVEGPTGRTQRNRIREVLAFFSFLVK